ncbi:hypothetical protein PCANC_27965 [Puccinia coronata f. sp. avenae]|uniref:Uncharacterized protein n=1 Tax=Puccinia coronata f. sp. avenae TaxID=200324 RepID=A0A2N5S582_9BASI|nr:hypothetical protein PCANC_27965 [Puccinia coronata f. sp. avenae]
MAADALSRKPDDHLDSSYPPPEEAESLFTLEPMVEAAFTKLRNLQDNHPEELTKKGFEVDHKTLYHTNHRGQKVRIITNPTEAMRAAKETHIRLGHRNLKDTLFQLRNE